MLAGRPHLEPHLRPGADSVVVSEIYVSLQGESTHQGLLCAFVRLTGCHLRCSWCDSAFAFQGGRRMATGELVAEVRGLGVPRVEITGGEPLLQPGVYPLMRALLDSGLTVLLETSGAIDVRLVPSEVHKIVDLKAPSSGESDRMDLRVLDSMGARDELKLVIADRRDYEWALEAIRAHRLDRRPFALLFSAVYGKLSPRELAGWVISDRVPARVQLQLHKYLWEPNARRV